MKLELIVIIGIITTVLTIFIKVIGFPDQMKKNYQRKSTKGISNAFYILSFITYVFWTLHGILVNDSVVYLGQGLGIVTTGIILYQIYIYRKNN